MVVVLVWWGGGRESEPARGLGMGEMEWVGARKGRRWHPRGRRARALQTRATRAGAVDG